MTPGQLSEQIRCLESYYERGIPLIDAGAEGWVLLIDQMVVSPITFKKSWTKMEVIELFNKSKTAETAGLKYSTKSLSAKRFDRILRDIVKLILNAGKPLQPSANRRLE